MKKNEPTFFRRFSVFATFSNGGKSKLVEPVDINLGFSGLVDPDSGMILNLVEIDSWIHTLKKSLSKKTYKDRWDFCKLARLQLRRQIARSEFTEVHFEFHDLFVKYVSEKIFFGWKNYARVKNARFAWASLVALTLQPISKSWPPLNGAQSRRWQARMRSVDLEKKWLSPGAKFYSFDYTDFETELKIRVT